MVALITVGCARSGDVVILIDSTMLAEPVEVVAVPVAASVSSRESTPRSSPATERDPRLTSIRDSAAALDARFRALRDTLGREVGAIDTADRRTRAYAVRYAEIRRRTLAAEAVRAARDSARRREEALRVSLDSPQPVGEPRRGTTALPETNGADGRAAVRVPAVGATVTLSLAPGEWSIGIATRGSEPRVRDAVTVRRGSTDTVRIPPPRPDRPR